jgi:hypothetical protein
LITLTGIKNKDEMLFEMYCFFNKY